MEYNKDHDEVLQPDSVERGEEHMNGYDISDKKVLNIDGGGSGGAGYGGGMGGYIWPLIYLAALRGEGGGLLGGGNSQGAGVGAVVNANTDRGFDALGGKLDTLSVGQNQSFAQLTNNQGDLSKEIAVGNCAISGVVENAKGDIISNASDFERSISAALSGISAAAAECCCSTKTMILSESNTLQRGQDSINHNICMQTNTIMSGQATISREICELKHDLSIQASNNAQKILDTINGNETARLLAQNTAQAARIAALEASACADDRDRRNFTFMNNINDNVNVLINSNRSRLEGGDKK